MHFAHMQRPEKKVLFFLELELQVAMNHQMVTETWTRVFYKQKLWASDPFFQNPFESIF